MFKTINYGITKNYLKHWDSSCMLREIFQNFKDFGSYKVNQNVVDDKIHVCVSNDYKPENINFLFIGESSKGDRDIGGYGEGLKMAGLIAARNGFEFAIRYNGGLMKAEFNDDDLFEFKMYQQVSSDNEDFTIEFTIDSESWIDFISKKIGSDEVIHENNYGRVVDKEPGSIYVGGLYVCKLDRFKRAYDFNPEYIKLDRDRSTPSNFDVEYYASRINDKFNDDFTFEDLSKRDFSYIGKIPEDKVKDVNVEISDSGFVKIKDPEGNNINNSDVREFLVKNSYVSNKIRQAKMNIAKKLGLIDMLEAFINKHSLTASAKIDMEIIIKKAKGEDE